MTQRPQTPARQFGRYELTELIAIGGMGEIHLARMRGAANFEKRCVIKKILPHLATEPEFVARFIDEANLVVQLTHGNIVPVFDMGEHDGEYYIAMDFVDGVDLRTILRRLEADARRLPVAMAVHVACEVCKGLGYAHRRTDDAGRSLGIIHRDVSPSNILISRDGEVKLVDFGIAKARSSSSRSVSGRLQGKFGYMSPEQARGEALDPRSDVFSTGVVLYEMLTGARPFHADNDLETLERVRTHRPPPPSAHRDEIPEALDALVLRALSANREARFDSADAMLEALMAFLTEARQTVTAPGLASELGDALDDARPEATHTKPRFEDLLDLEADRLLAGDGARTATASLDLEAVDDREATAAAATTATASLPTGDAPASMPADSGEPDEATAHVDVTPDSPSGAVADSGVIASGPLPAQQPPPPRVSRWLAAAIGLLAVAILAFVAWQITRSPDTTEASETTATTTEPLAEPPAPQTDPGTEPVRNEPDVEETVPDDDDDGATAATPEPAGPATFIFSVDPADATIEVTTQPGNGWRDVPDMRLRAVELDAGRSLEARLEADGYSACTVLVENSPESPAVSGPDCAFAEVRNGTVFIKLEPEPTTDTTDTTAGTSSDDDDRSRRTPRNTTRRVELQVTGPSSYRVEVDGEVIDGTTFEFPDDDDKITVEVTPDSKNPVVPWRTVLERPSERTTRLQVAFGQVSVLLIPHTLADGTDIAAADISIGGRQIVSGRHRTDGVWVPVGTVEVRAVNENAGGERVGASTRVPIKAGKLSQATLELEPLD